MRIRKEDAFAIWFTIFPQLEGAYEYGESIIFIFENRPQLPIAKSTSLNDTRDIIANYLKRN